jgi:hypothetical protein
MSSPSAALGEPVCAAGCSSRRRTFIAATCVWCQNMAPLHTIAKPVRLLTTHPSSGVAVRLSDRVDGVQRPPVEFTGAHKRRDLIQHVQKCHADCRDGAGAERFVGWTRGHARCFVVAVRRSPSASSFRLRVLVRWSDLPATGRDRRPRIGCLGAGRPVRVACSARPA